MTPLLAGFETRQRQVEERLASLEAQHADATREMKAALRLTSAAGGNPLAARLARSEIESALQLAERLAAGNDVTYDGEDRDWLWALTRHVTESLDATSRASSVPGGFADEGFWDSEIGGRYLEWQREAIARGVQVRRIFVIDQEPITRLAGFRTMLREQQQAGISVRVFDASTVSPARRLLIPDIVLFDRQLSYELVPASKFGADAVPYFVKTRLVLEPSAVARQVRTFEELWQAAVAPEDGAKP